MRFVTGIVGTMAALYGLWLTQHGGDVSEIFGLAFFGGALLEMARET